MTTIATVLQLVAALVLAAQQPGVPADLRAQALQLADTAIAAVSRVEAVPVVVPVVAVPVVIEDKRLEDLAARRAEAIAEREVLYRKAEAMGGSRDTVEGYKRYLTKDVSARLDAINDEERKLKAEAGLK